MDYIYGNLIPTNFIKNSLIHVAYTLAQAITTATPSTQYLPLAMSIVKRTYLFKTVLIHLLTPQTVKSKQHS